MPVVRTANVAALPPGAAPLSILLIADTQVAGPDMPPERLARIVEQANALAPDIILIAGDFVSDRRVSSRLYSARDAVAPLFELRATHGVYAVAGNHDHWRGIGDFRMAFADSPVTYMANESTNAGPIRIVGIDDPHTRHDDVAASFAGISAADQRPLIVLTHSPDVVPHLPAAANLVFAGHTHGGQIRLPVFGAIAHASAYGNRFLDGHIVEGGRNIFVTAGIGTSILPLRLGAVPDMWLVELTPRTDTP
nr:metallophosphoesterase [Pacificimonas pallii]